jgi:hypothetical protein
MLHETLYLERGKAREQSVNEAVDFMMRLPPDKRYILDVEEVRALLPRNLLSRIKIPVRRMAKHLALTYEQMNDIIHDRLYPKRDKTVGGVTYQVFVPSNQLTPDEAREIEVGLYQLAADIGCPMEWKGNWQLPEQAA